MRGLGPGSTLVLINGRRVAPFGFTGGATFVDINQIPVGAIDRIEVLLDGASAIYGSDAVAGVVNVIMRRGYRGIEVAGGWPLVARRRDRAKGERDFGVGDRRRRLQRVREWSRTPTRSRSRRASAGTPRAPTTAASA